MAAGDRRRKRLRWFDLGASAFEASYPALASGAFGLEGPAVYVCPICRRGFPREAAEDGRLTLEDVPPKALGGRPLVLTCNRCNNTAGSGLDAHAHRKEAVLDVILGRPSSATLRVRATVGDTTVRGVVGVEGTLTRLLVAPGQEPEHDAILTGIKAGTPLSLNFSADAFSDLAAKISWLRAGYLTMFAVFGYGVVFAPSMEIVRRQILEPNTPLMRTFTLLVGHEIPFTTKRLLRCLDPEINCWAVQFGPYAVFLPQPRDAGLYDRLAERAGTHGVANWQSYEWPKGPLFCLPPDESAPASDDGSVD